VFAVLHSTVNRRETRWLKVSFGSHIPKRCFAA
jgi:hypothetical protein